MVQKVAKGGLKKPSRPSTYIKQLAVNELDNANKHAQSSLILYKKA